jgi:signal transduction histidine kinase
LDNALRYTPGGGVIKMEANKKGKIVQVIVADNGSGIASQHLPHLFERFYQADRSGGEDGRSNGLGLSIAKALIEAQGGSIHLDSQPGEGTHVTLSLQSAG